MPAELDPKFVYESRTFDALDVIYVFCMFISRLFFSRMKLGVKQFRNLIEFVLQGSIGFASIFLYFISFRAWIENCIKKLYDLFLQGQ